LGHAGRNPGVGKHSDTLPTHFGSISSKPIRKLHFWQQFHDILTHYFCCQCIAILYSAEGNPEVGKHSGILSTHFG
jgi:hypothetical protein